MPHMFIITWVCLIICSYRQFILLGILFGFLTNSCGTRFRISRRFWTGKQSKLWTLPQKAFSMLSRKTLSSKYGVGNDSTVRYMLILFLTRTCQLMYIEVSSWMIRMESSTKYTKDSHSVRHRAGLFINGLLSAYKITHYVKTMMNYHSHMRKPMTKSTLLHLCKLLELLKVWYYNILITCYFVCSYSQFSSPTIVAHSAPQTTHIISYRLIRRTSFQL